jgi:hypothetical protein
MKMRTFAGKKAISDWISWVMITLLMVTLGVFVYRWSTEYAKSTAGDLESRAYSSDCDSVAIEVVDACQNDDTLNINVANKKDIRIDKVMFNFFDVFGNTESREAKIRLEVGKPMLISILKQDTIKTIKVLPALYRGNKWVICSDKEIEYSDVKFC